MPHRPRFRPHARAGLLLAMLTTVGVVVGVALLDQRIQSEHAMNELAHEQGVLAAAIAVNLDTSLAARSSESHADAEIDPALRTTDEAIAMKLLARCHDVERVGGSQVLLRLPGHMGLLSSDGRTLEEPSFDALIANGASEAQLSREEASRLGLPARRAVAGIARVTTATGQTWGLVTLASAQRLRDQQRRSDWRLALGTCAVALAVLGFGGMALIQQRKELELAAKLDRLDIERERDEQLTRAEKMATLAALSTGITHEIASPLGVIVARIDSLRGRLTDDPRALRNVDVIAEQVERIERVMRGFLALARGDTPVLDRAKASDLVHNAVLLVRHRFENSGVGLTVELPRESIEVSVDPPMFEQVLVNLLLNACYASAAQGEPVTISVGPSEDGSRAVFRVQDHGVGMPEDVARRAMDPFFTTKPSGAGSGLGLAIAHEIVKHHRGTLTITSSLGQTTPAHPRGTTVRVEIPRRAELT